MILKNPVHMAFCIFLLMLFACSSSASGADLLQKNTLEERRTTVGLGKTITIELPANPSTGYSWGITQYQEECRHRPCLMQIGDGEFTPRHPNTMGSDGKSIWTFSAVHQGTCVLRFAYRRPWEPDDPVAVIYYYITVTP
jgi:predicted secreted protein